MCSFEQLVSLTLSSEAGLGLVSESFHIYCSMNVFLCFAVEAFLSLQYFLKTKNKKYYILPSKC